jgi:hypothetical protein
MDYGSRVSGCRVLIFHNAFRIPHSQFRLPNSRTSRLLSPIASQPPNFAASQLLSLPASQPLSLPASQPPSLSASHLLSFSSSHLLIFPPSHFLSFPSPQLPSFSPSQLLNFYLFTFSPSQPPSLVRLLPVFALGNINLQRHLKLPDTFHNALDQPGNIFEFIRRHFKDQFIMHRQQHG